MSTYLTKEEAVALYEHAPCGYISTAMDGTILRVNRTFADWVGREKTDLLEITNLRDMLTASGKIFYDTHYSAVLQLQGSVGDMALELLRPDRTSLPVLVSSIVRKDGQGISRYISSTLFNITDRRRYERELLEAKRRAAEQ